MTNEVSAAIQAVRDAGHDPGAVLMTPRAFTELVRENYAGGDVDEPNTEKTVTVDGVLALADRWFPPGAVRVLTRQEWEQLAKEIT